MRHDVMSPPADVSQASGRTGLSRLLAGRRRRPTLLVLMLVVGFGTLAALRQTAPAGERPEPAATAPVPEQSLPVRFTPSPTAPPRGTLPRPDVVDASRNRLIGNLSATSPEPGEQGVFAGITEILNWYCPESTALDSSIEQMQGWRSVRVVTRPRAGTEIELFLHWTGTRYRWQGPRDALDQCW